MAYDWRKEEYEVTRPGRTRIDYRQEIRRLQDMHGERWHRFGEIAMRIERRMARATRGLPRHPEGWEHVCACDECRAEADTEEMEDAA